MSEQCHSEIGIPVTQLCCRHIRQHPAPARPFKFMSEVQDKLTLTGDYFSVGSRSVAGSAFSPSVVFTCISLSSGTSFAACSSAAGGQVLRISARISSTGVPLVFIVLNKERATRKAFDSIFIRT